MVQCICAYYDLSTGKVQLVSDCLKAIKTLQRDYQGITKYYQEESDLVVEAMSVLSNVPIRMTLSWIQSHYKGTERTAVHDLNDEAHLLAKNFLYSNNIERKSSPTVIHPPTQEVIVQYDGYTLTKGIAAKVKYTYGAPQLRHTIVKQAGWNDTTFDHVDWVAYGKAFSHLTRCRQISIAKLSHSLLNTNHQNHKYYGTSLTCPCCWDDIETLRHVFICQQEEVAAHRKEQLQRLIDDLNTIKTPILLNTTIIQGISSWIDQELGLLDSPRCPFSHSVVPSHMILTQAYQDQSQIGWDQLLRGRISTLWSEAANFINLKNGFQPDTTWAYYLIASLLTYSASLWKFRCGVLHGHTQEESLQKQLGKLHQQVTQAYQEYENDPHIISSHERSIFTARTLEQRLKQGQDTLTSWLCVYNEATRAQTRSQERLAISAKSFFQPRSRKALLDTNPERS